MNKLKEKFENKENVNIGYIVAGYPSLDYTKNLLSNLDKSNLDIIEIGIPYSDPLADGMTIAKASFEASQKGINTDTVFDLLINEKQNINIPLVFLVYYNVIFAYGIEKFIEKMIAANVQGIIVPDLPYEEAQEFVDKLTEKKISFIPLISVTSQHRVPLLVKHASSFIYAIGSLGVTGTEQVPVDRLGKFINEIKKETEVPVSIGFGVKNRANIEKLRDIADGVIVGTSIVKLTNKYTVEETITKINDMFM